MWLIFVVVVVFVVFDEVGCLDDCVWYVYLFVVMGDWCVVV